jgi:hypothetical protein
MEKEKRTGYIGNDWFRESSTRLQNQIQTKKSVAFYRKRGQKTFVFFATNDDVSINI